MTEDQNNAIRATATRVLQTEGAAVSAMANALPADFADAVSAILATKGRVILSGIGKSGHIGGKIAATLASTGTNAFFVHPAEMSHGDLGMLRKDVTLLAISNSGESRELRDPLIYCQREGIPVIGLTQRPASFLGRSSAVCLTMPQVAEACPNGLAPTTSTLMTLALGDALAMVLMDRRGFTAEPLRWYADYCCRDDYGASSEQVSAWAGIHYFASRARECGRTHEYPPRRYRHEIRGSHKHRTSCPLCDRPGLRRDCLSLKSTRVHEKAPASQRHYGQILGTGPNDQFGGDPV